jgi:DNA repair exonuclease SbcCD ATPase subunit
MIEHIELNRFKKHAALEAAFQPGLNALIAPNAAGKSTLLKAIAYALLGTTATGSRAAHLTQWGESGHRVSLKLRLNGVEHVVTRTPKSSSIHVADRLVASGTTATNQYVEDALGLSSRDLLMLTVSPQGETQALLDMGAAGLQKRVEDIARVGLIDQVLSNIATDQTKLDAIAGLLPAITELEQQCQEKQQHYREVVKQIDRVTLELGTTQAQLLSAQQQLKADAEAAAAASKQYALVDILNRQLNETEAKIREAADAYIALKSHQPTKPAPARDLDELLDELNRRTIHLREQQTERQGIIKMLDVLDGKLTATQTALELSRQAEAQLPQVRTAYDAALRAFESANIDWLRSDQQCRDAEKAVANAVCHACNRPFSETESAAALRRAESAQAERHEKLTVFDTALNQKRVLNRQLDDLVKMYDPRLNARYQQDLAQRDVYAASLKTKPDVTADLKEVSDQASLLRDRRQQRQAEEETYRRWDERRTYALSHMATLETHQAAIKSELDATTKTLPSASLADLTKVVQSSEITVTRVQARLTTMTRESAELMLEHSALTAQIDQYQKDIALLRDTETRRTRLQQLALFLRKNRSRWMAETWENLLLQATHLLETVTERKLSNLIRTDSGEFSLTEDGREVPVTELSGAQRSMVGLCLRVALSQVFYSGNLFLLLDEPCADMSEDNAARVAGMLQGLTGTQIIMVSHRQSGVMSAGNVIAL